MIKQSWLFPKITYGRSHTLTGKRDTKLNPLSFPFPFSYGESLNCSRTVESCPLQVMMGKRGSWLRELGAQEETFRTAANGLQAQSTPALGPVSWQETEGVGPSSDSYKTELSLFKKNYKAVENLEPAYIANGNIERCRLLWKSLAVRQKVKHRLT